MKFDAYKPTPQMTLQMIVYVLTIAGAIVYIGKRDQMLTQLGEQLQEMRVVQDTHGAGISDLQTREAGRDQRLLHHDQTIAELKNLAAQMMQAQTLEARERIVSLHRIELELTRIQASVGADRVAPR